MNAGYLRAQLWQAEQRYKVHERLERLYRRLRLHRCTDRRIRAVAGREQSGERASIFLWRT